MFGMDSVCSVYAPFDKMGVILSTADVILLDALIKVAAAVRVLKGYCIEPVVVAPV
jgi:hypothetical protein